MHYALAPLLSPLVRNKDWNKQLTRSPDDSELFTSPPQGSFSRESLIVSLFGCTSFSLTTHTHTHVSFSQSTRAHHRDIRCQAVLSRRRAAEQMFQQQRAGAGHGTAHWHRVHAQQLIWHAQSCWLCVLHSVYVWWKAPCVHIWCIGGTATTGFLFIFVTQYGARSLTPVSSAP